MTLIRLEIIPLLTAKLERRLLSKLVRVGECLEFSGFQNVGGYGIVSVRHPVTKAECRVLAHRLAWVIEHRTEIPADRIVCHRCNNPRCCNTKHLYLGTHQDNANDMMRSHSLIGVKGPAHPRSKYAGEARSKAIVMRASGTPFEDIAQAIGCHRQTVERWWAEHVKAVAIAAKMREF
jgi:hypothetical protein